MKHYYWRTENGHCGLQQAVDEHAANSLIVEQLYDIVENPDDIKWEFTRVDNLLDI